MRFNVHPPRAFHNRIARYLGVIVAAALVAALGLPSVAQAQSIARSGGVVFSDMGGDAGFKVTWTTRLLTTPSGDEEVVDNWIVTLTKPNGEKVVVDQYSTNPDGGQDGGMLGAPGTRMFIYDRDDAGTWWFQVDACFEKEVEEDKACSAAKLEKGTAVGYTHGPFPAPKDLAASLIPTGVALTWTSEMSDYGFERYEYTMDADAAKPMWKPAGATGVQRVDAEPGEYTFSVRARGKSDNDKNTVEESMGRVASVTITVGDDEEEAEPVPTLPEIAALFLAMLLLGSGAYLIRGRQSGGLTNA